MSTILAKGNGDLGSRQSGGEKITLQGSHFLKIVYDGPNELSNLFFHSELYDRWQISFPVLYKNKGKYGTEHVLRTFADVLKNIMKWKRSQTCSQLNVCCFSFLLGLEITPMGLQHGIQATEDHWYMVHRLCPTRQSHKGDPVHVDMHVCVCDIYEFLMWWVSQIVTGFELLEDSIWDITQQNPE